MKIIARYLVLLAIFFQSSFSVAQSPIVEGEIFTLEQFLGWVEAHHPVARQAGLLNRFADAELMKARGAFDPKLFGYYDQKSFDNKNYYQIGETGVGVPTWFGADFKVSYNWTDGIFLNDEEELPAAGQIVAGFNMPLLRGMMFDERRAQVQQAELVAQFNEADRRLILNDLLLDATESYWNWVYAYNELQTFIEALELARQRFDITRESYYQGDKPAIDTLEALTQIQMRQVDSSDAQVLVDNALVDLSYFLWYEEAIPLKIVAPLQPEQLPIAAYPAYANQVQVWLQNLETIHPDLIAIRTKQTELEIKERLKREFLKPQLDIEYNLLSDGLDFVNSSNGDAQLMALLTDNYKWGVTFNFPLFLRKERAGLDLVRLEQQDTQLKFAAKELDIENKIVMNYQLLRTVEQQVDLNQELVANYRALLEAETEKFRFGESSIFLLNNREQKLIEAQLKLLKFQAEYRKLLAKVEWAAGQLGS
ncbi:MAG: TolC family protein [Bacteroidota bacterium]